METLYRKASTISFLDLPADLTPRRINTGLFPPVENMNPEYKKAEKNKKRQRRIVH